MLQPDLGHPMQFVSSSTSLKIGICTSNQSKGPCTRWVVWWFIAAARSWALHATNFYKKNGITHCGVCSGLEKNGGHGCKRLVFFVPEFRRDEGQDEELHSMVNFNQLWKVNLDLWSSCLWKVGQVLDERAEVTAKLLRRVCDLLELLPMHVVQHLRNHLCHPRDGVFFLWIFPLSVATDHFCAKQPPSTKKEGGHQTQSVTNDVRHPNPL